MSGDIIQADRAFEAIEPTTTPGPQPQLDATAYPVPAAAKWSFTTRRVRQQDACGLSTDFAHAVPGDLVLARTEEIGQHKKVQLASGRYSENIVGDYVVMTVGDRYAPDQFEGRAEISAASCEIIAGGGVLGRIVEAHDMMEEPTRVAPLGLLTDLEGEVINIAAYSLPEARIPPETVVIGVFGTSMNAGKTTTCMSIAHGLRLAGYSVAGVKATGTGAFGDYNAFLDAGVPVTDFVDAGMPSTYRMPLERIEAGFETLVGTAAADGAGIVIVEFADGVFQEEAAAILRASPIADRLDGIIFSAFDAAGAVGGVSALRSLGHEPFALSGLMACAPLAVREAERATGISVVSRDALRDPEQVLRIAGPVLAKAAARARSAA